MAIFDLQQIVCLDQNERFADELYLVITDSGGKAVARYELGSFEKGDKIDFPSAKRPDVFFAFTEDITLTVWENDPSPFRDINDDKIGSFLISPNLPGDVVTLNGSNAEYLVHYDIV